MLISEIQQLPWSLKGFYFFFLALGTHPSDLQA